MTDTTNDTATLIGFAAKAVLAARSLDSLRDALNACEAVIAAHGDTIASEHIDLESALKLAGGDLSMLPVFSNMEPASTAGVFSYDDRNLLLQGEDGVWFLQERAHDDDDNARYQEMVATAERIADGFLDTVRADGVARTEDAFRAYVDATASNPDDSANEFDVGDLVFHGSRYIERVVAA